MADWGNIVRQGLGFLTGAAAGAVIEGWLNDDFQDALRDIAQFVQNAPMETIDMMDQMLLMRTLLTIDPERRQTIVKYYAYFKIAEYVKYEQFRGFPNLET